MLHCDRSPWCCSQNRLCFQTDPTICFTNSKYIIDNETEPHWIQAAMSERSATWDVEDLSKRGIPTPELINAYDKWGNGGFGVIITGNILVDPVRPYWENMDPKTMKFSYMKFWVLRNLSNSSNNFTKVAPQKTSALQTWISLYSLNDIQLDSNHTIDTSVLLCEKSPRDKLFAIMLFVLSQT